jgi:hypothetical protein
MNRIVSFASALSLALSLTACASALSGSPLGNTVKPDVVKAKASSDLDCKDIAVSQVGGTSWKAEGCNKVASYVCWTSVGMGDGMCTREGAMPHP